MQTALKPNGKTKTCPICGYVAKHQGALNMHSYHCKMKNGRHEAVETSLENCSHEWRLLNNRGTERAARAAGFYEVCVICQEVQ